jgi:hypothetical protein
MQEARDQRSLGELFADLTRQTTTLIRQEVELAKTEMSAKATSVGRNVAFLAVGGAVAYAGFLALLAAAIIALATVADIEWWFSALIVGLIAATAGGLLIIRGRDALQREDLTPRRTIETLKEDAEWAKDRTR